MQAAWDLGVVAVKSAGNSGIGGTYFDVDVSMAVGSISVCSVGDGSIPVDKTMDVSYFSSFGPVSEWSDHSKFNGRVIQWAHGRCAIGFVNTSTAMWHFTFRLVMLLAA